MPVCDICGRPFADCLCVECGRVVCGRCFDGYDELCMECAPRRLVLASSSGISSAGLRMLGMMLVVFGFLLMSMAVVPEDAEGVIVIFPFVIGNVSGWTAVVLSVAFLGLFIATSLLPWIMFSRRRPWVGYGPMRGEPRRRGQEVMEYMITIDLPPELRDTVYIEGEEGAVHLRSRVDLSFHRSYTLPERFEVDEYDHEYDNSYLILKLKLKRRIF